MPLSAARKAGRSPSVCTESSGAEVTSRSLLFSYRRVVYPRLAISSRPSARCSPSSPPRRRRRRPSHEHTAAAAEQHGGEGRARWPVRLRRDDLLAVPVPLRAGPLRPQRLVAALGVRLEVAAQRRRQRQLVDVVDGGAGHDGATAQLLQRQHCQRGEGS